MKKIINIKDIKEDDGKEIIHSLLNDFDFHLKNQE
jgi:hypothetical protein